MKKLNNRNFGPYFGARQCSVANNPSLPLTHLARGICIATIAACIALVPQAGAITFDGTSSGIFVNPTGPSGMSVSGVGTYDFRWGVPFNSFQSRLVFGGTSFAGIAPDEFFNLGTLWYINGTAWGGTEADTVDLRANLAFTSPVALTEDFDFNFNLVNTSNFGTPTADSVFLTSLFPATIFNVDGIDYTLQIGFGSVTGGSPVGSGFSDVDEFFVQEDSWASAQLVGLIKTVNTPPPPSVPDTGSTLALMAMAVVGLGGLKQYLAKA
jgi:hypothetical protein